MEVGMTIRWSKCCGKWRKVLLIQRRAAPGLGIITHKIAATWSFVVSGFGPFQCCGKHVMEFCRMVTMSVAEYHAIKKSTYLLFWWFLWFSELRYPNLFLRPHHPCACLSLIFVRSDKQQTWLNGGQLPSPLPTINCRDIAVKEETKYPKYPRWWSFALTITRNTLPRHRCTESKINIQSKLSIMVVRCPQHYLSYIVETSL